MNRGEDYWRSINAMGKDIINDQQTIYEESSRYKISWFFSYIFPSFVLCLSALYNVVHVHKQQIVLTANLSKLCTLIKHASWNKPIYNHLQPPPINLTTPNIYTGIPTKHKKKQVMIMWSRLFHCRSFMFD